MKLITYTFQNFRRATLEAFSNGTRSFKGLQEATKGTSKASRCI